MKKLITTLGLLCLSAPALAININPESVEKICNHKKQLAAEGKRVSSRHEPVIFDLDVSGNMSPFDFYAYITQSVDCKSKKPNWFTPLAI